jgi:hypothetical protein
MVESVCLNENQHDEMQVILGEMNSKMLSPQGYAHAQRCQHQVGMQLYSCLCNAAYQL